MTIDINSGFPLVKYISTLYMYLIQILTHKNELFSK